MAADSHNPRKSTPKHFLSESDYLYYFYSFATDRPSPFLAHVGYSKPFTNYFAYDAGDRNGIELFLLAIKSLYLNMTYKCLHQMSTGRYLDGRCLRCAIIKYFLCSFFMFVNA